MDIRRGLTFDDITLVPIFSNIGSRTDPSVETWLTNKLKIGLPLLPANMDRVIGEDLAKIIWKYNGAVIYHRFTDFDTKRGWLERSKGITFLSTGIGKPDQDPTKLQDFSDLQKLIYDYNLTPAGIVVDVAHIHSTAGLKTIEAFRREFPQLEIIAGNIVSPMAVQDLYNAGASACKCGIGGGSICSTRLVTGHGVPMATTIIDCYSVAKKLGIPLISDGAIKSSAEVIKAIALGACSVMIGKLFSKTLESAANKYIRRGQHCYVPVENERLYSIDEYSVVTVTPYAQDLLRQGNLYNHYRGQASANFQNEFKGGLKPGTVPEGEDFYTKVTGTAEELIEKLIGGLKSGMSYSGSKSIKELQRKVEVMEVTPTYLVESSIRSE